MTNKATLNRTSAKAFGVIILLTSTACSQPPPTTPGTATSKSPPATSGAQSHDSSSGIKNPKILKSVDDTCQLLTPDQVDQLGAQGETNTETTPWGEKNCKWSNEKVSVTLSKNTVSGKGFSRIEERKDNFANFDRTTVKGYPAARINSKGNLCVVGMGISSESTLSVSVSKYNSTDPQHDDPCAFAEKVAAEALKNIPDA